MQFLHARHLYYSASSTSIKISLKKYSEILVGSASFSGSLEELSFSDDSERTYKQNKPIIVTDLKYTTSIKNKTNNFYISVNLVLFSIPAQKETKYTHHKCCSADAGTR